MSKESAAELKPLGIFATKQEKPDDGARVTSISYSPSGLLYTGTASGLIHIWDLPVGKALEDWNHDHHVWSGRAHESGVEFLEVIPGNHERLVSIGVQGDVKLWDLQAKGIVHTKTLFGYDSIVYPLVVSSLPPIDGKVAGVGNSDSTVYYMQNDIEEHHYLIFATEDGALNLWNLDEYGSVATCIDRVSLITGMDVDHAKNILAVGTADGVIKIWDLSTLSCAGTMQVEGVVTHVKFMSPPVDAVGSERSPKLAVASSNGTKTQVGVWSTIDISQVYGHEGYRKIQEIASLDENRIVIAYWDSLVTILDLRASASEQLDIEETRRNEPPNQAHISCSCVILLNKPEEFIFVYGYTDSKVALFINGDYRLDLRVKKPKTEIGVGVFGLRSLKKVDLDVWKMTPGPELESEDVSPPNGSDSEEVVHFLAVPDEFLAHLNKIERSSVEATDKGNDADAPCQHPWHGLDSSILSRPHHDPADFSIHPGDSHPMPQDHQERVKLAAQVAQEIHDRVVRQDSELQALSTDTAFDAFWKPIEKKMRRDEVEADIPERKAKEKAEFVKKRFDNFVKEEGGRDTIAVGISDDGRTVSIAGNVKRRYDGRRGTKSAFMADSGPGDFGLRKELHEGIIKEVIGQHPQFSKSVVQVVEPTVTPTSARENAGQHAEMQLIAHSHRPGSKGIVPVIGVSKPPCERCREELNNAPTLAHPTAGGLSTEKVQNWQPGHDHETGEVHVKSGIELAPTTDPESIKWGRTAKPFKYSEYGTKVVKTQGGVATKISTAKTFTTTHVPSSKLGSVPHVFRAAGGKPRAVGGIGAMIESVIENHDRDAFADATGTPVADVGTYQTRSTVGAYARAMTVEARAGVSVLEVGARGPNAAIGAHAGPSGLMVYGKAELVRAEASAGGAVVGVGLDVNTGASIGPDGVDASVLGFGFSIGPRVAVRIPIADVSCVVM